MENTRRVPVRLGGRSTIAEQTMTEMLGRAVPEQTDGPDSAQPADVPRLDVCAFNSSI